MPELRMAGSTFELNIRGRVKARVVKFELRRSRLLRPHFEFEFRHPSKIINGRHMQRSGQHTPARQKKNIQKSSWQKTPVLRIRDVYPDF